MARGKQNTRKTAKAEGTKKERKKMTAKLARQIEGTTISEPTVIEASPLPNEGHEVQPAREEMKVSEKMQAGVGTI
jgi:hypothetical protein